MGRAIAVAIGVRGMHVVVHHHDSADGAEETVRQIRGAGGAASVECADLTDVAAAERLIDRVVERHGTLSVLVNSAAVMVRTPVGGVAAAAWDGMFALNARAPFFLSQRAAPALRASSGCIVNIADLAAYETWPAYVPHAMTKAAVVQMTRGLARALAPTVRVNGVAPGIALLPEDCSAEDTEHLRRTTPLQRLGTPDDVAQAVLYLIEATYVTGEVIRVDGGRHIRT